MSFSVIISLRLITLWIDRHYQKKLLLHFLGFQGYLETNPALSKMIGCLKMSDIDDQAPNIFNLKHLERVHKIGGALWKKMLGVI